jgi:ribosomal protein S6--L-glutamate ligase
LVFAKNILDPLNPLKTIFMRVAILSRNPKLYSTRRLKEAGEARGHKVEVIDHMKCVLFIEKKSDGVVSGKRWDYFDAIIPRIGASVTFYGAVVRQFEMMKVFTPSTRR